LSALLAPFRKYFSSGERNFRNSDPDVAIRRLAERYREGQVDYLDGVTVQFGQWWFNVRKSNTEPLLRLNLEAGTPELLRERLDEVGPLLGVPAGHG
jgi:phosphomannomutase